MSAWSLYYVARWVGFPVIPAALTSTVLDGGALLSGYYSLKSAKAGEFGTIPRGAMYLFVAASAYINSRHGVIDKLPEFASILYAVPPVAAAIVYELHTRNERSKALSKSRRKLSAYGLASWGLYPVNTLRAIRTEVLRRSIRILRDSESNAIVRVQETVSPENQEVSGSSSEFPKGFSKYQLPSELVSAIDRTECRAWAKLHGFTVGERGSLPAYVMEAYAVYLTSQGESESMS